MEILILLAVVIAFVWFLFWLHKYVGSAFVGGVIGFLCAIPYVESATKAAFARGDTLMGYTLQTVGGQIGCSIFHIVFFAALACLITYLKTRKSAPTPLVLVEPTIAPASLPPVTQVRPRQFRRRHQ